MRPRYPWTSLFKLLVGMANRRYADIVIYPVKVGEQSVHCAMVMGHGEMYKVKKVLLFELTIDSTSRH